MSAVPFEGPFAFFLPFEGGLMEAAEGCASFFDFGIVFISPSFCSHMIFLHRKENMAALTMLSFSSAVWIMMFVKNTPDGGWTRKQRSEACKQIRARVEPERHVCSRLCVVCSFPDITA